MSGSFAEQPLNAVGMALIEDTALVPSVPKELAPYPVSARFDSVSLKETIGRVLAPFDHVVVLCPDGESPATIFAIAFHNSGNPTSQADDITAPIDVMSDERSVGPPEPGSEPKTGIVYPADESLDGSRASEGSKRRGAD